MFWVPLEGGRYDPELLTPWFALPEFLGMAVNDSVRKCVLFLGTKEKGKFRPRATAFVASIREGDFGWRYLVTAEHVISGLTTKGHEILVRSNLKNGTVAENKLSNGRWWFHPDNERHPTDVAVIPIDFSDDEDFLAIPLNLDTSMAATQLALSAGPVTVGHEVYITGLFRSHYGQQQNVPIVRIGNIAMMRGEMVYTKYCGYTDAYLIEARSIGGLSGSPVFLNIPFITRSNSLGFPIQNERTHLLGLMHGHFDVQNLVEDIVTDADSDDNGTGTGINTGIGVVIPVEKISETLDHPDLREMRKESAQEMRKKQGATPDLDASDAPGSRGTSNSRCIPS